MRAPWVSDVPVTSCRPGEYSVAGGAAALFVVSAVAPGLGMPNRYTVTVAALITAAACVRVSIPAAISVGGIGWLLLTGFAFNEYGELRLHGFGDWLRLGLLLGVAVLTSHATGAPTTTVAEAGSDG
jgi:hypothetical protein